MSHREKSEEAVAAILSALWERGFQSGVFKFEDTGLHPETQRYYDASFQWLIDEGLVRVRNQQTFSNAPMWMMSPVLTAKGFSILGKPSPEPSKPIGTHLKEILKEAGRSGKKAAIASAIKIVAEYASDYFDRSGTDQ